jgi:hypothetical protein
MRIDARRRLSFPFLFGGDREGHTANYVNNAANRAARGRVGVAGAIQSYYYEYCH